MANRLGNEPLSIGILRELYNLKPLGWMPGNVESAIAGVLEDVMAFAELSSKLHLLG